MQNKQSKEAYAAPVVIKHDALKEMTGGTGYHTYQPMAPSCGECEKEW